VENKNKNIEIYIIRKKNNILSKLLQNCNIIDFFSIK